MIISFISIQTRCPSFGGQAIAHERGRSEFAHRGRTVIDIHVRNSSKKGELDKDSTCANFAQVQNEGGREIKREITHYNLDVITSFESKV